MPKLARTVPLAGLALTLSLAAGCSLGEQPPVNVSKGSLAAHGGSLSGVSLTVGGKEFTEELLLCEVTAQALESAGAKVKRSCGMSGSNTVRSALTSGNIDMYWEYTGTGWISYLDQTKNIDDPEKLFEMVGADDLKKNGIAWVDRAPANDTYAVAAAKEKAKQLGVTTLSDYAKLAKSNPSEASFCGAAEFFGRNDGWPGVEKAYNFHLPQGDVAELAAGPIYTSIDKSKPCNFGEVFATDGRISALGLQVLQDDKHFFTVYNPALTIRESVLKAHPQIAKILKPVADALTDKTLASLNAQVDVAGKTPQEVAKSWLVSKGFVRG